jgi:AcrR family transcriptional regulator
MAAARLGLVSGDSVALSPSSRPTAPRLDQSAPPRVRIVDGALRCIAEQGIARTTVDDVARKASCSRATVYRVFPGGKEAILRAVVETESARLFSALGVVMGEAESLEDVLVSAVSEAARRIRAHEALAFLSEHEPEVLMPHLAFGHMDELLAVASDFVAPFLGRWLPGEEARRVAEWSIRIVLSYVSCPSDHFDLTEKKDVGRLVRTFVVPGVTALCGAAGNDTGTQLQILITGKSKGRSS